MDRPEIILAPGPTPIPPEVLLAQGSPLVYHRGSGFGAPDARRDRPSQGAVPDRGRRRVAHDLLRDRWARVGVQNVFSPGDEVLVPLAGYFSERWTKLAKAHGLVVRTVEYDWGRKIVPDEIAAALADHPVKAVLLTHSETSTGVIQPVRISPAWRTRPARS